MERITITLSHISKQLKYTASVIMNSNFAKNYLVKLLIVTAVKLFIFSWQALLSADVFVLATILSLISGT